MSSLWTENIEMPEFPTLEKDIRTQVLIIGIAMAIGKTKDNKSGE